MSSSGKYKAYQWYCYCIDSNVRKTHSPNVPKALCIGTSLVAMMDLSR